MILPEIPGQVIHHTRLVHITLEWQGPREQRGLEGDLGERGPSQGAGVEWDTRISPQLLEPDCEPVPEPA